MIYVVFDTNVIVSSLLKPESVPGLAVKTTGYEEVIPIFTDDILSEYSNVLSRKKFHFDEARVQKFLSEFTEQGEYIDPISVNLDMPDPKDIPFMECLNGALKIGLDSCLVTGNGKHFPNDPCILTPREYLDLF